MADVALISVIATGTVGVLGSAGALYSTRISLKINERQRRDSWREDLRNVLDDAAQVAQGIGGPAGRVSTVGAIASEAEKGRVELEKLLGRLGIRLGPESEVYKKYSAVRDELYRIQFMFNALPQETPWVLPAHEEVRRVEPNIFDAIQALNGAIDEFLTAAAGVTRPD